MNPLVRSQALGATVLCVSRTDPVAIVTGGSCGVGREIARALADRGYGVAVVYLRAQAQVEALVAELLAGDGTALAVRADTADAFDVERVFSETTAAFGGVDVVVHAGLRGASVVNAQAARQLRHAGAIVNVSSSGAIASDLARALRARDITVNGVAPGRECPGADHAVADLVGLLDNWRRSPGE